MSHVPLVGRAGHDASRAESHIFHACLQPHRSLSMSGFAVLALVLVLFAFIASLALLARGLWPAAVFVAGNLGFLLVAMRLNRLERHRLEQVIVDRSGLAVRRFDRRSRLVSEERLPLYGLTLDHDHDPDFGLLGLVGRVRQQRVELARDLAPNERAAFASAMLEAMHAAGCPPRVTRRSRLPLLAEG